MKDKDTYIYIYIYIYICYIILVVINAPKIIMKIVKKRLGNRRGVNDIVSSLVGLMC